MQLLLLVEDNIDTLTSLKMIMEMNGYQCLTAKNGKEALDIIQQKRDQINYIILDLMLPVMNGWLLLDELEKHEDLKKIPVIALTGFDKTEPTPERIVVIQKPAWPTTLLKTLKRL